MKRFWLLAATGLVVTACTTAPVGTTTISTMVATTLTPLTTTTSTSIPPTTTTTQATTTTTVPEAATEPLVALVVGDFGVGNPNEYAVAETMRDVAEGRSARVLITTGDNFYSDDVASIWQEPYGWVEEMGLTVYAAWGNHDLETTARQALVEEVLAPEGRWYATRLGSANLLVLDANRASDGGQAAYARNQLQRFINQQMIVAFHQPAHSCSQHGSTPDVIEAWQHLFERFGVDLVLSGHDHNYQRIFQGNVTYLVTGGGGAPLYEIGACPPGTSAPLVANDTDYHFLVLTIAPGTITVEAIAADGSTIDEFSVANRPPRSTRPEGVR